MGKRELGRGRGGWCGGGGGGGVGAGGVTNCVRLGVSPTCHQVGQETRRAFLIGGGCAPSNPDMKSDSLET